MVSRNTWQWHQNTFLLYFFVRGKKEKKKKESKPKPYNPVILPGMTFRSQKICIFNYHGLNIKSLLPIGVDINIPVKYEWFSHLCARKNVV